MNNKKSTKRALLSSVLSLVLCMAMLIGTTFAWFTDSVSSTNNIIKSGNLDVELEYHNGDSWEKVTANTNVFEENTLWEPGHTEVVYLKVSNLGTLALKYQLGVNIVNEVESINVAGEALRLSDYIEFGAIDGVSTPYADRAAARAAVTNSAILSTGYTKAGNIEAGADEQYVALVVYMPETVGNEANYRTGEVAPQIDLGINLMATQYTSESDSFDEKYDEGAKFGGAPAARVTVLADMPTVESIRTGKSYTLDTGYVFNTTETYDQAQLNAHRYWHADFVATFEQDVDGADVGLAGQYDAFSSDWLAFELDGLNIKAGIPVRMLINEDIGTDYPVNYENLCEYVKEFSCGAFAVDANAMAGKTMTVELRLYETTKDPNATSGTANEETGKYITIGTYSYTFPAVQVASLTELSNALKNGATSIDAGGASLGDFYYDAKFTDGAVIKNAKFTYFYGGNVEGTVTFENCEFVSDHSYCANFDSGNGNIIFNNCTFDGWSSFGTAITNVEMNGCTFLKNYSYGVLRFYQTAQLNKCTFADNFEGIDTNMTGYKVEFTNCTGIDGKIYNNGSNKGIWVVDGTDISDTVTSW